MQSTKAVFLSYASQDAQAALRICEALRSAGIEVWFDQSELRGGDTWEHNIRQQTDGQAQVIAGPQCLTETPPGSDAGTNAPAARYTSHRS